MSILKIIDEMRMIDLSTTVQDFLDAYLEIRLRNQVGPTTLGFFCLIYN